MAYAPSAYLESVIRANTLDEMGPPAANLSMNTHRLTTMSPGIFATDAPDLGQLASLQTAYIVSGCVWTADSAGSTLNGSMTSGTVVIAGILLTVAAVSGHAFAASSDTYIDFQDNADGTANVTYTAVGNNAMSPVLPNSGTLYNTIRCAIVTTTASSIASNAKINQGSQDFATPPTTAQATTVAAGSNGNPIATATLSVAANSMPTAGLAVVDTTAGTGSMYGALISYTSGGGTTTLSGITVIVGSGNVATNGNVTTVNQNTVCDGLGNPIFPTWSRTGTIAYRREVGATTTTSTSLIPLAALATRFIVPAGPPRQVRLRGHLCYVQSSAAAGTSITAEVLWTNSSGTNIAASLYKVNVTSDGIPMDINATAQLAAGTYVGWVSVQQGAAGTLTVGGAFVICDITVEMV
jgi:hypothetical protein